MGSERHVKHFRFKNHFFLPPIRLAEVCGMKYRWLQRAFYATVNYALSALLFLSSVSKTLHYLFASFYLDISTLFLCATCKSSFPLTLPHRLLLLLERNTSSFHLCFLSTATSFKTSLLPCAMIISVSAWLLCLSVILSYLLHDTIWPVTGPLTLTHGLA